MELWIGDNCTSHIELSRVECTEYNDLIILQKPNGMKLNVNVILCHTILYTFKHFNV